MKKLKVYSINLDLRHIDNSIIIFKRDYKYKLVCGLNKCMLDLLSPSQMKV